jgi:phosphoribosylformylglycinamidine synthase I
VRLAADLDAGRPSPRCESRPTSVGVVVFPGSNCEHDVVEACRALGAKAALVGHATDDLGGLDAVVLPGGFAHGDYLRPGALARFAPVMAAVTRFARAGGSVVGICNGFQVLTEAGLLPGALRANASQRFICDEVVCEVVTERSVLTADLVPGTALHLPVNHYDGNYTCSDEALDSLVANDQIVMRYRDNPNGSRASIAAVCNLEGNVVGCMPHPERAFNPLVGSTDGALLLRSLIERSRAPRLVEL